MMFGVSAPLLYLQPFRDELDLICSPEPFYSSRIAEQRYAPVRSQQTRIAIHENIHAGSRGKVRSATK